MADPTLLGFIRIEGVKLDNTSIEVHYLVSPSNDSPRPSDEDGLRLELSIVEAFAKDWVAGTKSQAGVYPAYTPIGDDKNIEMIIITGPYRASDHAWVSGWVVPTNLRQVGDPDRFVQKYQFHAQAPGTDGIYVNYTVNVRNARASKNSQPTAAKLAVGRGVVLTPSGSFANGDFLPEEE